jgi:hypothetical protein
MKTNVLSINHVVTWILMSVLFVSNVGFLGNNLLPSAHVHLVMVVPLPRIASPQDINQSITIAAGPHYAPETVCSSSFLF